MTIRIVGLPSQPAFIRVDDGQYLNLATIGLFRESGGRIEFTVNFTAGHQTLTGVTEPQLVAALKAAGFTIIEGLV